MAGLSCYSNVRTACIENANSPKAADSGDPAPLCRQRRYHAGSAGNVKRPLADPKRCGGSKVIGYGNPM